MKTIGAEAIELEQALEARPSRVLEGQPAFEVVSGGGLDARVRAGVSSEFLARAKAVIAGAVLIFALGSMRVALTSATVSQLSENAQMRAQISTFETNNDSLRVERSLMASSSRIDRIATENYGMVAASSFDVIVIEHEGEGEEAAAEEAAAEEATAEEAAAEEAMAEETAAPEEAAPEEALPSIDPTQLAAGL